MQARNYNQDCGSGLFHAYPVDALRLTVNWNHLFSVEYVNDNSYAGNTIPNAPKNAIGVFASAAILS